MPEEQELVLTVRLDDQASQGLQQLQQHMRNLGGGQQQQSMEKMKRGAGEAGGATKDLASQLGGLGQIAAGAASVGVGILAAKVIDLGAQFLASITNFNEYATSMQTLAQQAYAAGDSMAQMQQNIDVMTASGVEAGAAARQLTAFGHAWAEMGDQSSATRQKLIQGLQRDPEALDKMQQFLDESANMSREGALEAAKEFAQGIRENWMAQGKGEAYGARWEQDFYQALGIPDLGKIRGTFGEVSEARKQLMAERGPGATAYLEASSDISIAWRDIKQSFQAILVDSPLVQSIFQGMASAMRGVADFMGYVETAMRGLGASQAFKQLGEDTESWLDKMGRQAWDYLVDDFQYFVDQVGDGLKESLPESWHAAIDAMTEGIQSLIDDPSWENLATMMRDAIGPAAEYLKQQLPASWHAGIDSMVQGLDQFLADPSWENLYGQIRSRIPEAWRDTLDASTAQIREWMDEIKRFFADPNWLANATDQVVEFVRNAAENLYDQTIGAAERAIRAMVQRMTDILPGWAKKMLGLEGAPAAETAAPPLQQPAGEQAVTTQAGLEQVAAAEGQFAEQVPPELDVGAEGISRVEMRRRERGLRQWRERRRRERQAQEPIVAPAQVQAGPVETQMGGLEPDLGAGEGVIASVEAARQLREAPQQFEEQVGIPAPALAPIEAPAEAAAQPAAIPPRTWWEKGTSALRGLFGGGEGAPEARQEGGPVTGGQPYLVGERGPEIVVPQGAGDVASTADIAAWEAQAPALGAGASGRAGQVGTDEQFAAALKIFNPFGPVAKLASGVAGMGDVAGSIGKIMQGMGGAQSEQLAAVMGERMTAGQMGSAVGEWAGANLASLGAALDRAATQNVNVTGTGKLSVDVNAPPGTHVNAAGEGLFKTTEITRQTQMINAMSGPLAATGVGSASGVWGGSSG